MGLLRQEVVDDCMKQLVGWWGQVLDWWFGWVLALFFPRNWPKVVVIEKVCWGEGWFQGRSQNPGQRN